jgi:hypothetical protein
MEGVSVILNNSGDNTYQQSAREFLTSPITASFMRIILSTEEQLDNTIKIRNSKSEGGGSNRDISIRNYVSAKNKSNLIIEVPLSPPVYLDGQTYFETILSPSSEMDILFFVDYTPLADVLK